MHKKCEISNHNYVEWKSLLAQIFIKESNSEYGDSLWDASKVVLLIVLLHVVY